MAIIPDKQDSTVLERQEKKLKPPSMYKVVLLNDDFTPMEFVVMIVQEYFNKDRETATQVMLKVHREGRGVCGVYTRDIASTKVEQVVTHARQAGLRLQLVREEPGFPRNWKSASPWRSWSPARGGLPSSSWAIML